MATTRPLASTPLASSSASVVSRRRWVSRVTWRSSITHDSLGSFCGQITVTRTGSVRALASTAAISASLATVWFATTRRCVSEDMIASRCVGVAIATAAGNGVAIGFGEWTVTIAWRALGMPNAYGLPTTWGISSKLNTGGGEETCHSRVSARHGLDGAIGPRAHELIML